MQLGLDGERLLVGIFQLSTANWYSDQEDGKI